MKWDPATAVALHAAAVLSDPKSTPQDAASARKALASPYSPAALDALPDADLERLEREAQAELDRLAGLAPEK